MAGPNLPSIIAELSRLQDVTEQNVVLNEHNSTLVTANDALTVELNKRNAKIDNLNAEIAKFKANSTNKRALTEAKSQIQRLQNEKDELKRRLDDMEQSLITEKSVSAQTIQELRANMAAKDGFNQIANSEADSAKKQVKELEKKLTSCDKARISAINQLGQSNQYYKRKTSEIQAEMKTLRGKAEMLSSTLRLNEDDISRKVKQLEKKNEEIKGLKAHHSHLIGQWSEHSEKLKVEIQGLHIALQKNQTEKGLIVAEYEEKVKSLNEKFLQSQNDFKGEAAAAEARALEAERMSKEVKAQAEKLNDEHQNLLLETVNLRNQLQSAQEEAEKRQAGQKSAEEFQQLFQEIESLQEKVKTLTRQKKDNCEAYRAIWEWASRNSAKGKWGIRTKISGI